jgi:thioesterase domain-containing protein
VAHAVAGQLAADGEAPAGVVLIDTHDPREMQRDERLLALIRDGAARPAEEYLALAGDARILAGGAYIRLFERWHPDPLDVPALLVRAAQPTTHLGALPADLDWRPHWPLPHDTVDVPGDHFTLLGAHADAVAAGIRNWLTGVSPTF